MNLVLARPARSRVRPGAVTRPMRRQKLARQSLLRRAVAMLVRGIAFGIGLAIVALWVRGGGITGVHDLASLFISTGRITGLLGSYLLVVQVLLMARLPFLEWVASFDQLTVIHRLNSRLVVSLILAHVSFIVSGYALSDRIAVLPQLWSMIVTFPSMIQATIGTVMLLLVGFTSWIIVRRRLRYEAWYGVHLMAYLGIYLAWLHQIPTGGDFLTNPLAAAAWTALYVATLQLVIFFRVLQPAARALWHGFRVAEVKQEGPGVVSFRITGRRLNWIDARSGQFFQWRFLTQGLWHESHPFSLSAAPDGNSFRITVKDLGDFTRRLATVKPGTRVVAEGPFGSFTSTARTRPRAVLVAGGIGITPIRALLEDMPGDLTLVYRAVHEGELIFRRELDALARKRGVTVHYVLGDHRDPANRHLLSADHLRRLVPGFVHSDIYVCGPPALMRMVESAARRLGVPETAIHSDVFAY